MDPSAKQQGRRSAGNPASPSPWIGITFFALAAWFLLGPKLLDLPTGGTPDFDRDALTTAPRRISLSDPPTIRIGGFDQTCMECHRMFPTREVPPEQLLRHDHIRLNHGINERCRNCHDVEDRDRLILPGGETIGFDQVVQLCAKCHGPTYRDWERGMHGRTNGHWDETRGPQRRLTCTECHDPHNPRQPAMDPIEPLPGPHALRAEAASPVDTHGDPHRKPEHEDPLRKFLVRDAARMRARDAERARRQRESTEPVEFFQEESP